MTRTPSTAYPETPLTNPPSSNAPPPKPLSGHQTMTYLLTAWGPKAVGPIHNQHLLTFAGLQRLIQALIEQTAARQISITILRDGPTHTYQLGLPT